MLVKVEGTHFVRDTETMALISTNTSEKNEYQTKVKLLKTQKDEINTVKKEIDSIKNDMREIKELLLAMNNNK
jgi:cell shape-determining protein MreC